MANKKNTLANTVQIHRTPTNPPLAGTVDTKQNKPWSRAGSDALYAQAEQLIPGGVNSPVRACKSVHGQPLYFTRGHGAELTDVDGNHYIDFAFPGAP